ncbi:transporter [Thioclava sp. SK-1]|uniref:LysE family translocator n=1 Tax=Thioclava sp. SK-1 TaxID=1889770 RepID=UPI000825659B|nr:LysE family translocator [Thioclava sp. SK-1]OCX64584.1 transporter [Thioclava sp. SK-1]
MIFSAFLAIYLVHLAAAISPGPAVLLCARTGLTEGFMRGTYLAIGVGLGACVWACAALFGLAVLFKLAPALLTVLKFFGAGYLAYLAYKMWRDAAQPLNTDLPKLSRSRGPMGLIWLGVTTQLANPKPAVFFGTIFLTFIPVDAPLWAFPVILLMVFINDAGWNVIVARVFSLERTRQIYLNAKAKIDRVFGGLLALLAAKLALT